MRRLLIALIACASLLPVSLVSAQKAKPAESPAVTVPCGAIWVPYSVYRLPIVANTAFTMTLQASGAADGLISFTAQNFRPNGFYWTRTPPTCSTCTLTLPNVTASSEGIQLAVDVYGGDCPGPGVTVTNFNLQTGPAAATQ